MRVLININSYKYINREIWYIFLEVFWDNCVGGIYWIGLVGFFIGFFLFKGGFCFFFFGEIKYFFKEWVFVGKVGGGGFGG